MVPYVLGIDPGIRGAFCVLGTEASKICFLQTMPETIQGILALAADLKLSYGGLEGKNMCVYIEKAFAIPEQPTVRAFTYGVHYGVLLTACVGLDLSLTQVLPRVWQPSIHRAVEKTGTAKERSLKSAGLLFPTTNFYATKRCKKPHDGLVDAALIAHYGVLSQRCINSEALL